MSNHVYCMNQNSVLLEWIHKINIKSMFATVNGVMSIINAFL